MGIGVKTQSSTIIDQQADRVRTKAQREGLVRDVQPEEPKPVKKAVKKAAAKKSDDGSEEKAPVKKAATKKAVAKKAVAKKAVAKKSVADSDSSDTSEPKSVTPTAEVVEAPKSPVAHAPVISSARPIKSPAPVARTAPVAQPAPARPTAPVAQPAPAAPVCHSAAESRRRARSAPGRCGRTRRGHSAPPGHEPLRTRRRWQRSQEAGGGRARPVRSFP